MVISVLNAWPVQIRASTAVVIAVERRKASMSQIDLK